MGKLVTKLKQAVKKTFHFIGVDIWRIPIKEFSPVRGFLINQLRILVLALRGVREDKVLLRAPALTFYSLLSIVPAAALAFGIAQGFGLEVYLERQLQAALVGREEVLKFVMDLTESVLRGIHGGTIAVVGLVVLLYTVFMLLLNIEKSFNEIWQIGRGRPWSRKFSDYLAMMFVAPLFFIAAGAATVYLNAQVQAISYTILNPLLLFLVRLIPFILLWIIFSLLYFIMPNTNVQFSSALASGIIAGTIFQLVQWGYVYFQIGVTRFGALYGSFAAVPLLLIWMQVGWVIVLFGAELSYANDNVENYEFETESRNISPFNKKILALYILQLLISAFQKGEGPLTPKQISNIQHIPNNLVRSILYELEDVNLINEVRIDQTKKSAYQPALDIHAVSVKMVIERLEHRGLDVLIAKPSPALNKLKQALQEFYAIIERSDKNKLLKDL